MEHLLPVIFNCEDEKLVAKNLPLSTFYYVELLIKSGQNRFPPVLAHCIRCDLCKAKRGGVQCVIDSYTTSITYVEEGLELQKVDSISFHCTGMNEQVYTPCRSGFTFPKQDE